jgi:hypothetical protein
MTDDDATINDDDLKEISDDAFDEVVEVDDEEEAPAVIVDEEKEVFGEVDPDAGVDEEDAELLLGEYDDSDSF